MHEVGLDLGNSLTMPSRSMIMNDLKQQVQRSAYQVDCGAVAEAFIARQRRCWYPATDRMPEPSRSTSAGSPSTTRPNGRSAGMPAGPHAQSS